MKSLKKVFIGAVIAALVGMFTSCTFLQDIAYSITICGTWEREFDLQGVAMTEEYVFIVNGTYTDTYSSESGTTTINGTWQISGGKLNLTVDSGTSISYKLKVDENTLKLTSKNGTFTYTRVGANN